MNRRLAWFRSGSVRTQVVAWNVAALMLLLGALGVVCRAMTRTVMIQSIDGELDRSVQMFRHPPPNGMRFDGRVPARPEPRDRGRSPEFRPPPDDRGRGPGPHGPDANNPFRAHVFRADGTSAITDDTRPAWDHAALRGALAGKETWSNVDYLDEPLRVLTIPGFTPDRQRGATQVAYPLRDVNRALSGIDLALLLLIPVGALAAWWMGSALTGRILSHVHRMSQAANSIGATGGNDFAGRLPVSGNDEFSELANTFNAMLGRLEHAFEGQRRLLEIQRRFTADASHELKTPLTVIKGNTSLALRRPTTDAVSRGTFEEIDAAAGSMSSLVQDLLLLARADEGKMGAEPVEMLMGEVLGTATAQARRDCAAPISLSVEPEDLTIVGNEVEMVRLFRNLLDNAIRYTPVDGTITVSARRVASGVEATITDTGAGIAPEHLPHLGERFYRVDESRSRPDGGSGLGLSICRSIVEAHHGRIEFTSEVGRGTTVRVVQPGRHET